MSARRTPLGGPERDRLIVHARSAQRVLDLLQLAPDRGGDLSRTVMLDPSLAAAVLRAANSAHLGYSRRIGGVRQAMVMLGGTLVASLAAGRVADLVFDPAPPEYPEWLWPHSLAVAAAASVLARRMEEQVDEAYTAGLLHDVGWLHAASNGPVLPAVDVEHGGRGADLLARWNLPERLVGAVLQHHAPSGALVDPLARIVVAAHGLARAVGAESPEPAVTPAEALQMVGLHDVRPSAVTAEVEQELVGLTSELRSTA